MSNEVVIGFFVLAICSVIIAGILAYILICMMYENRANYKESIVRTEDKNYINKLLQSVDKQTKQRFMRGTWETGDTCELYKAIEGLRDVSKKSEVV